MTKYFYASCIAIILFSSKNIQAKENSNLTPIPKQVQAYDLTEIKKDNLPENKEDNLGLKFSYEQIQVAKDSLEEIKADSFSEMAKDNLPENKEDNLGLKFSYEQMPAAKDNLEEIKADSFSEMAKDNLPENKEDNLGLKFSYEQVPAAKDSLEEIKADSFSEILKSNSANNFYNNTFHNEELKKDNLKITNAIKFLLTSKKGTWPKEITNTAKPNLQQSKDENVLTFINHATFLAEIKELKILFDPIFSDTAGPLPKIGTYRRRRPGIELADLPKIDIILISHNHYDHLDLKTIKFLSQKYSPKIIVPMGNKKWLENKGVKNVIELNWWDTTIINTDYKIHFVPSQHSSGRTPFDHNKTLWGGFVVEHPSVTLFHAGDTGYAGHFKKIGNKFNIDIAMLPIGDYLPSWFLKNMHMKTEEAIQAHKDLKAKKSFGMHSESFRLSGVSYNQPEKILYQYKKTENIAFSKLEVGASYKIRPNEK